LALDIEEARKIAEDESVALGGESLDETLAALAQRCGGSTGRVSVFVEADYALDHRELERCSTGLSPSALHRLAGLQGAPTDPANSVPLGEPPKYAL
jgi:hypothetical protein